MKKEAVLNRDSLTLPLALAAIMLLLFSAGTPRAFVASPQGKGGAIKPAPTPTPVPKKSTPPKKSTSNSGRVGATKPADNGKTGKVDAVANERIFWESIRNSTNPEEFRVYLKKYPNGEFADLARTRLNTLETAAKEEEARKEEAKRREEGAKRKEDEARRHPSAGSVVKNSIGIELVYVPQGNFLMGSTNHRDDEKPVHTVTISNGFYMGKYEVTQAQWMVVMRNNPSKFKGCDNCPVEEVSWNDAQEFIQKLNQMNDGYTYRLPTEAEWEYACRAGTSGDYAGDLDSMAWYYATSGDARLSGDWNYERLKANKNRTHPVGSKLPNGFGLFDMHGNVWEWCQDLYHDSYNGAPIDGSAWLSGGEQKERVLRGGAWFYIAEPYLRSSFRNRASPNVRSYDTGGYGLGFRMVAVARTQ